MRREVLVADVMLLVTAAIWGAAFVAQRVGMEHVGPLTFNGVRFALGALSLLPLCMRTVPSPPRALSARAALWGSLAAGVILFAGATLQQAGLVYTTAGKAGFITGLYVVIVPLMGLFLGQRAGGWCWFGAVLAAIGMYLLSVTENFSIGLGDLLVFIGSFFWAGHVVILGLLAPRTNPVRLAALQFCVCSVLSLIVAVATEPITWEGLRGATLPILYGGLCSVGIAYTLQVLGQRHAPPAHAAIILSMESVFAALTGWVLLGEVLDSRGLVGCGLMLFGMLAAQAGEIRHE